MNKYTLQGIIEGKSQIQITYRRERDEAVKSYTLEPVEIKSDLLKDGSYETYLYAIKLPKATIRPKIQKFIVARIISAN